MAAHTDGIGDLVEELQVEERKKRMCSCEIRDEVESDSCDREAESCRPGVEEDHLEVH